MCQQSYLDEQIDTVEHNTTVGHLGPWVFSFTFIYAYHTTPSSQCKTPTLSDSAFLLGLACLSRHCGG